MNREDEQNIYSLLGRVIAIVLVLVAFPLIILSILSIAYVVLASGAIGEMGASKLPELQTLITSLWSGVIPLGQATLSIVGPVLVLVTVLAAIRWFAPRSDSANNFGNLLYDLPSLLALVIVGTICLLPFAGVEVPQVLNNVALVVVGFYFGKRETNTYCRRDNRMESENLLP